ncbi:MAG: hypothetical protein LBJ96_02990 [Holosporaceae bacterium]|jgi:hypothetical protein|nr:hypothetical protein [Holosporaceae bacterium]
MKKTFVSIAAFVLCFSSEGMRKSYSGSVGQPDRLAPVGDFHRSRSYGQYLFFPSIPEMYFFGELCALVQSISLTRDRKQFRNLFRWMADLFLSPYCAERSDDKEFSDTLKITLSASQSLMEEGFWLPREEEGKKDKKSVREAKERREFFLRKRGIMANFLLILKSLDADYGNSLPWLVMSANRRTHTIVSPNTLPGFAISLNISSMSPLPDPGSFSERIAGSAVSIVSDVQRMYPWKSSQSQLRRAQKNIAEYIVLLIGARIKGEAGITVDVGRLDSEETSVLIECLCVEKRKKAHGRIKKSVITHFNTYRWDFVRGAENLPVSAVREDYEDVDL